MDNEVSKVIILTFLVGFVLGLLAGNALADRFNDWKRLQENRPSLHLMEDNK